MKSLKSKNKKKKKTDDRKPKLMIAEKLSEIVKVKSNSLEVSNTETKLNLWFYD